MDVDMATDSAQPAPAPSAPPAPTAPTGTVPTVPSTAASAGSPGTLKLGEPRRRNRPALSCIQCRTRKIRCDRNEPCASCMKSKIVNCTYEEARRPKPRLWRLSPAPAGGPHPELSPTSADERSGARSTFAFRDLAVPMPSSVPNASCGSSTTAPLGKSPESISAASPRSIPPAHHHGPDSGSVTTGPLGNTAALAERVRQLEQQLADALKRPDQGSPSSRSAHTATSLDHGLPSRPSRPDSLMNGEKLFPLLFNVADRIESDKSSDAYFLLQKCKGLGNAVLTTRSARSVRPQLGNEIPDEKTARLLVDAYFRTFESVYRIIHRPTFWEGYRRYWENPSEADTTFVVLMQLCMAIGTCFQDEVVGLRRLATQWIHEAQVWLVSPIEKCLVSFAGVQVMCMLHIARETCGVESDMVWISAGSLFRTAMFLGLHRDPDNLPNMSVYGAELRRRVWATVLEIVLQSSLDSGAPPLMNLTDFDTRPPSNYDDDQLTENAKFPSIPRPPNAFTHSTVQIALMRSFPIRLAVAQHVNHFTSPGTFEETLKWNTELTNACRALSATFQPFYDPAGILPKRLSLFQLRLAEHMVHRFFLALNYPWLWSAHNNPTYYFARKMCVETSLKLYRAISTGSPAGDSGTASQFDDFTRLATCAYGAFRSVPTLAVLTICLELLWQVQEDRSFRQTMNMDHSLERPAAPSNDSDVNNSVGMGIGSGAAPRQELLEAVKYSIGWNERRIRCGETNVKGYLLFSALLCQAQALQRGASDVEAERLVLATVGDELNRSFLLLQDAASFDPAFTASGGESTREMNSGWGVGSGPDDIIRARGFNSIFNIHDADFFLGS
ncbi:uncharacterized protein C8A04DRAFT_29812 [Dichotomopilus funicola]|uniref:Zn(2)-C6 fungal-type domain-containing protein n=1 Tax=Dichotomopilus funicola TaxID=1934379 RepID=A0AAN6ZKE3_9PEZI|nr:hypothetical protein C8A04DRAFT_29812 [Dichotomopilus funicola]